MLNISMGREWLRDPDNSHSDSKLADAIAMENFATVSFLGDSGPRPGDFLLVETASGTPGEATRHW